MRKLFLSRLLAVILAFTVLAMIPAAEVSAARYTNDDTSYLIILEDDADLLDEAEEENLLDRMKYISAYGNVAFKTIASNDRSGSKNYSENYYYENFGNASGMVFLIDMDYRQLIISTNGAINKVVTVAKANTITDNVYRMASREKYYDCACAVFDQALTLLQGNTIAEPMKHICNAILALIAAMIIFFIVIRAASGAKRAGMKDMIEGAKKAEVTGTVPQAKFINQTRRYSPVSRSSGGGGGGGFSGGGGGGGFSGGSGGHGF